MRNLLLVVFTLVLTAPIVVAQFADQIVYKEGHGAGNNKNGGKGAGKTKNLL